MNYLIPYDFSEISRNALDHAYRLRRHIDGPIELLHIIDKEDDRMEVDEKFEELLGRLSKEQQRDLTTTIRVGDLFTDVAKEAEEGESDLIVMGTHGERGLQKIFGSHALKVITSSNTPFYVTQSAPPEEEIDFVVIPIELEKESIQIARFAGVLAKQLNAEVHLVAEPEKDEILKRKLDINLGQAKLLLKKAGVKHEISILEGKDSFADEVIAYGLKHDAEIFAIAHHTETILPQFERFSQQMITNRLELPCMIVNAHEIGAEGNNTSFLRVEL